MRRNCCGRFLFLAGQQALCVVKMSSWLPVLGDTQSGTSGDCENRFKRNHFREFPGKIDPQRVMTTAYTGAPLVAASLTSGEVIRFRPAAGYAPR